MNLFVWKKTVDVWFNMVYFTSGWSPRTPIWGSVALSRSVFDLRGLCVSARPNRPPFRYTGVAGPAALHALAKLCRRSKGSSIYLCGDVLCLSHPEKYADCRWDHQPRLWGMKLGYPNSSAWWSFSPPILSKFAKFLWGVSHGIPGPPLRTQ